MAKICKLRNIEKVYNVEEAKNRQDKSKLCISVEHCFSIFESNIIDFDQVSQLEITSDRTYCFSDEPHDNFALSFIKFKNIEYLSIKDIYIEPDIWKQFALNCTKLKEIFFYGCCELSKEYITEIFKILSLETLSFLYTDLTHWPKGPSNIKIVDLTSICSNMYRSADTKIIPEYEYFYTHQNLEEINIKHFVFPMSVLNLDKCLNLKIITIQIYEVNLHELVEKILQLPKLNKITFNCCYFEKFVTDNSLIFPNVKEIYLNDCYKIDNGRRCLYRDRFYQKNYTEEPFKHNLRLMIKQCIKLKGCMFDNENMLI